MMMIIRRNVILIIIILCPALTLDYTLCRRYAAATRTGLFNLSLNIRATLSLSEHLPTHFAQKQITIILLLNNHCN